MLVYRVWGIYIKYAGYIHRALPKLPVGCLASGFYNEALYCESEPLTAVGSLPMLELVYRQRTFSYG